MLHQFVLCVQSLPVLEGGGNLVAWGILDYVALQCSQASSWGATSDSTLIVGVWLELSIAPRPQRVRQLQPSLSLLCAARSFNRSWASKGEATPVIYSPYPSSVSMAFLAKVTLLQQEKDFGYWLGYSQ